MKEKLAIYCSLIVGWVYFISGISKVVDIGRTSYKISEYAYIFSFSPSPVALDVIALLLVVAEIVIGLGLVLKLHSLKLFTIATIFAVFFCIITFIVAYQNNMKECGCFGGFIHLTMWQSFVKNMFLLLLSVYALISYHPTINCYSTYKYCSLALTAVLAIIIACFFQPLHDFSNLSVGNRLIKIEKNIYEIPLEITLDGKDLDLSHVKDTLIIAITPYYQKKHVSQLKQMTDVLTRVSRHHPNLFLSSKVIKNTSSTANAKIPFGLLDHDTLVDIIPSYWGIIVISNGWVIGKWQQNALHTHKTPSSIYEIIN